MLTANRGPHTGSYSRWYILDFKDVIALSEGSKTESKQQPWDRGDNTHAESHLALKLDSLPPIICLSGRVDEAFQVDGEGAG